MERRPAHKVLFKEEWTAYEKEHTSLVTTRDSSSESHLADCDFFQGLNIGRVHLKAGIRRRTREDRDYSWWCILATLECVDRRL